MFAFGRKKSTRLGVDIGSTAIKLVELSQTRGADFSAIQVENYAIEPLPPNAVVEKKIANVEAVGATIRKAVARSGPRSSMRPLPYPDRQSSPRSFPCRPP